MNINENWEQYSQNRGLNFAYFTKIFASVSEIVRNIYGCIAMSRMKRQIQQGKNFKEAHLMYGARQTVVKKALSFLLVFVMAVTLLPVAGLDSGTARAYAAENGVELYFKLPENTAVTDWCVNAWKDVSVTGDNEHRFRPSTWGTGDQYPVLLSCDKEGFGKVTISGCVQGLQFVDKTASNKYDCWNSQISALNLNEAYFNPADSKWYKDSALTDEVKEAAVQNIFVVAGSEGLCNGVNWQAKASGNESNTLNQIDGLSKYSITYNDVAAGSYEYKILQDPDNKAWGSPWGSDDNRKLEVTAPADVTLTIDLNDSNHDVTVTFSYLKKLVLKDVPAQVSKGKSVDISTEATCYDGSSSAANSVNVSLSLKEGQSGVTLTGNTLTVDNSFAGDKVLLIASYNDVSTEISIPVVDKEYSVTINFYNQDWDVSKSDIYIFENGGNTNTALTFDKTVEDTENGITWAQGTIKLPYNKLGIIARKTAGKWDDGQDKNEYFEIDENTDSITLWYVFGKTPVTEKPVVVKHADGDRYIYMTYDNREISAAPKFYSWTINDSTHYPFTKGDDGKWHVQVKVPYGTTNVKYVLALDDTAADWVKDGGDHELTFPADQTSLYVNMNKGEEPTLIYPYNKGYDVNSEAKSVTFYYRDDEALKAGVLADYKVQVEVNGTTFDMTYNPVNARFEYTTELVSGRTYYRYLVTEKDATEATAKLDAFNADKEKKTFNGAENEYSYFTYYVLNADVTAMPVIGSLNYNTNDVIKISVNQNKSSDSEPDIIPQSVTIDESALGGKSDVNVDTANMAITIAVTSDIAVGTYKLPVKITDQFGNVYTCEATENVTARVKNGSDDFDWDESVIYFMVTDRFFDGDSSNNNANYVFITDDQKAKGVTTTAGDNPGLYHGGDFKGVTDKLDYLKDLGINTIWITPIVENIAGTVVSGNGSNDVPYNAAFHGYWASDFTKLNPALGTEDDFREMISEAHKRGIKIMVDIVINHAGYGTESTFGDMLRSGDDIDTTSDQKNPLSGLPDFKTEDSSVRAKLVAWQTAWMKNFGIDYYRVDTVKHVDLATWQALKNSTTEVNPSFKMIGEYSGAGAASNGSTLGTGAMDSDLDFDFNDWASQFVKGGISQTESNLTTRNNLLNNTYMTGQFLGSHDEDGFKYSLINGGMSAEDADAAALVAASLQITAKGQPVIYYGEETGLTGANDYPYQTNRYDMDFALANDSNETYVHYKKMLSIRNTFTDVFARGIRRTLIADDAKGLDVFERAYKGDSVYIALNVKSEAQSAAITGLSAGDIYKDYYSGKKYTVANDGTLTISVPAAKDGGTVVLHKEGKSSDNSGNSDNSSDTGNSGSGSNSGSASETGNTSGSETGTTSGTEIKPSEPASGSSTTTPATGSSVVNPSDDKKDDSTSSSAVKDDSDDTIKPIAAKKTKKGVFTDASGSAIKNSLVITSNGKMYYTNDKGKAIKNKVVKAPNGKKYALKKDGTVAVSTKVTIGKSTYIAKKDGTLGSNEIVKIGSKKYYADKNGKIVKNKLVTVNGKKYLTDKNGKIIIGKWIKKGSKYYYCSKSGAITKTKKSKKK